MKFLLHPSCKPAKPHNYKVVGFKFWHQVTRSVFNLVTQDERIILMPISAWPERWPPRAWSCPAAPPVLGHCRWPPAVLPCAPCFSTTPSTPAAMRRLPISSRAPMSARRRAVRTAPPRDPPLTSDQQAVVPIHRPANPVVQQGCHIPKNSSLMLVIFSRA